MPYFLASQGRGGTLKRLTYDGVDATYETETAAFAALAAWFDRKAGDTDWPSTRSQFRTAADLARKGQCPSVAGTIYRVFPAELEQPS